MNQVRFIIAGNVDDGKSTLTGRLLYDTGNIKKDILDALMHHDEKGFELASLTDGLKQERENGITIDVAYRYFYSKTTKFILVDAPGHQEFTKNFFTGASNCEAIIILIDAEHGITSQTQKHAQLADLLGIQHWVIAINKLDRCSYSRETFNSIKTNFQELVKFSTLNYKISFVPISALNGDNIVSASKKTNWYSGKPLLHYLQEIEPKPIELQPTRVVVERIGENNFLLWCRVLSGNIKTQMKLVSIYQKAIVPIYKMYQGNELINEANAGDCVCLELQEQLEFAIGDILIDHSNNLVELFQNWSATLFWMSSSPCIFGNEYLLQMNSRVGVIKLKSAIFKTMLLHNEIEDVIVSSTDYWFIDNYNRFPSSGKAIVIDKLSLETVGVILNKSL